MSALSWVEENEQWLWLALDFIARHHQRKEWRAYLHQQQAAYEKDVQQDHQDHQDLPPSWPDHD